MTRVSKRIAFENRQGLKLSGIVEVPPGDPLGHCLFAHCFTCGKDLKAIVRICRHLATLGWSVLRFDFTGIGASEGRFRDTSFSVNCDDVRSAVEWMQTELSGPEILIGHSLGGAAMMATAAEFANVRGLVTIASPSDTSHLATVLLKLNPAIEEEGSGLVTIGGREWMITTEMLEVLRSIDLESKIRSLKLARLIMHSPQDETLAIEHAQKMLEWSPGPSTLVNLHDSDHLLLKHQRDVEWVARWIALWSERVIAI